MATVINLDDAQEVNFEVHQNLVCAVTFTLSAGDVWSVNGEIKVGIYYEITPQKIYTVGNGLTINGQDLTWRFNAAEWGNRTVVFDASVIRTSNAQRDFFGRITVNKSFN
jgi:hypothetical protein